MIQLRKKWGPILEQGSIYTAQTKDLFSYFTNMDNTKFIGEDKHMGVTLTKGKADRTFYVGFDSNVILRFDNILSSYEPVVPLGPDGNPIAFPGTSDNRGHNIVGGSVIDNENIYILADPSNGIDGIVYWAHPEQPSVLKTIVSPDDGIAGQRFGLQISFSDNKLVIGTYNNGVFLFEYFEDGNNSSFKFLNKFPKILLFDGGSMGSRLLISNKTIVYSDPDYSTGTSSNTLKRGIVRVMQYNEIKKTEINTNNNYKKIFIGTAGGCFHNLSKSLDDFYKEAYKNFHGTDYSGTPNIGSSITGNTDPRSVRAYENSNDFQNVAGDFWYKIFKEFYSNPTINTHYWSVDHENIETSIDKNIWDNNSKFHTRTKSGIHDSVSILLFRISGIQKQSNYINKIILNVSSENGWDNFELYETTTNSNFIGPGIPRTNWKSYKYVDSSNSYNIPENGLDNKTYMLIYYKDYGTNDGMIMLKLNFLEV